MTQRFDEKSWGCIALDLGLSVEQQSVITKFFDNQIHAQIISTINEIERRDVLKKELS